MFPIPYAGFVWEVIKKSAASADLLHPISGLLSPLSFFSFFLNDVDFPKEESKLTELHKGNSKFRLASLLFAFKREGAVRGWGTCVFGTRF